MALPIPPLLYLASALLFLARELRRPTGEAERGVSAVDRSLAALGRAAIPALPEPLRPLAQSVLAGMSAGQQVANLARRGPDYIIKQAEAVADVALQHPATKLAAVLWRKHYEQTGDIAPTVSIPSYVDGVPKPSSLMRSRDPYVGDRMIQFIEPLPQGTDAGKAAGIRAQRSPITTFG